MHGGHRADGDRQRAERLEPEAGPFRGEVDGRRRLLDAGHASKFWPRRSVRAIGPSPRSPTGTPKHSVDSSNAGDDRSTQLPPLPLKAQRDERRASSHARLSETAEAAIQQDPRPRRTVGADGYRRDIEHAALLSAGGDIAV